MIKNYGGAYQRCRLGIRIYQNSKINEKKEKRKMVVDGTTQKDPHN